MKITKLLFGGLAALALAGCFTPVSAIPEPESGPGPKAAGLEPFTVTLRIGADGSARAVAGPTRPLIETGGICNVIQLVVLDPETNKVHTLTDVRQENSGQTNATLTVNALTYEKDYEFLLLMGHWDRKYGELSAEGNYKYFEDHLPTLLAAGHHTASIGLWSGDNTVTITMYPLVVDAKFTKGPATVAAATGGVFLVPGTWNLIWEVSRGTSGTNGFTDLVAVRKAAGMDEDTPVFVSSTAIVRDNGGQDTETTIVPGGDYGNQITLAIPADYTDGAGDTGSANFNLKYIPFSLKDTDWSGFNDQSRFDLSVGKAPEWIIRNGINDLAQNGDTDFSSPIAWGGIKNGNGALSFTVLDPNGDEDGDGYTNDDEIDKGYDPTDAASRPSYLDNMAFVTGGIFRMGSDSITADDKPIHTVTVSGFYMGKHEVTQKEWAAVMTTTITDQADGNTLYGEGDDYPMYYVTWYEAAAYCNALSAKEGLTPAYNINGTKVTRNVDATGYRLPTEAEWEYAARGGNTGESYIYAGSDTVDEAAWYSANSNIDGTGKKAQPVEGKDPNGLGLYDMSGNVWEWCGDWWKAYGSGEQTDPAGGSSGAYRVIRGGSWSNGAFSLQSAYRYRSDPSYWSNSLGFRLVRPRF
jgi:formylglycine-generating enzyme required for sulfatase activity